MRLLLVLMLLLTSGCSLLRKVVGSDPKPEPPSTATIEVVMRPILVTSNGVSEWNFQELIFQLDSVNTLLGSSNIHFKFLPLIKQDQPWYDVKDEITWADLCVASRRHYIENNELPIMFVNTLSLGGRAYAGMASYPSNFPAIPIFQHGIAVARNKDHSVTAHEIGHAFNLQHTWHHQFPSLSDCNEGCDGVVKTGCNCNIMSYCHLRHSDACSGKWLTDEQIKEARLWCMSPPRVGAVTLFNATAIRSDPEFRYTSEVKPVD
jgi:hypothetical protein